MRVWRNKLVYEGALARAALALVGGGSAALLQHRQARQEAERPRVVMHLVSQMFSLNAGARSAVKPPTAPDVVPEQFVDTPAQARASNISRAKSVRWSSMATSRGRCWIGRSPSPKADRRARDFRCAAVARRDQPAFLWPFLAAFLCLALVGFLAPVLACTPLLTWPVL